MYILVRMIDSDWAFLMECLFFLSYVMYVGTFESVNNFFLYQCLINRDFYDKKEVFVNVKQGDKWKVFKKKIKTAPKHYTLLFQIQSIILSL